MPQCRQCHDFFTDRDDWTDHMRDDHGEELDWCGDCQKRFVDENALQQHSRIHKPREHECFGCYRQFESYSAMLIHLESGNCKVNLCDLDRYAVQCYQHKKYVMREYVNYLKTTDRTQCRYEGHWDSYEQVWECDGCEKTFADKVAMLQHLRSAVHDPWLYKCPTCEVPFRLLSALVQHVESDHCSETIWTGSSIWKMLHYIRGCVERA